MNQHHKFECSMLRRLNPRLELLTSRINAAESITKKVRLAGELEQEVSALLDCANHQAGEPECRDCRLVAGLRSRAAQTVARAGQIAAARAQSGSRPTTYGLRLKARNPGGKPSAVSRQPFTAVSPSRSARTIR